VQGDYKVIRARI